MFNFQSIWDGGFNSDYVFVGNDQINSNSFEKSSKGINSLEFVSIFEIFEMTIFLIRDYLLFTRVRSLFLVQNLN